MVQNMYDSLTFCVLKTYHMSCGWNLNEKNKQTKNTFSQNVCITINTAKVIPKLKLKRQKMFSINMVKG